MWLLWLLPAYYTADLFVGLYHLLTDRGWNIPQQVRAFREHHEGQVVFDLKPVFFALPVVALGLWLHWPFLTCFAACAGCAELSHYYSHRPREANRFVRLLQTCRVIIRPAAHAKHHDGVFNRSYCVLSGWANPLVDWIARYVPQRRSH